LGLDEHAQAHEETERVRASVAIMSFSSRLQSWRVWAITRVGGRERVGEEVARMEPEAVAEAR
jgi:hypothetical protein